MFMVFSVFGVGGPCTQKPAFWSGMLLEEWTWACNKIQTDLEIVTVKAWRPLTDKLDKNKQVDVHFHTTIREASALIANEDHQAGKARRHQHQNEFRRIAWDHCCAPTLPL